MWLKILSDLQFTLVIVISLMIGGVYYFWKYDDGSSVSSDITQLKTSISQAEQEIKTLQSKQQELKDTSEAFKNLGTQVTELYKYIPHQLTSSQILGYINSLTKQSGVHSESIQNYGSIKKEKLYEKIKISLVIRGLFNSILLFLTNLTKLDIIITVEQFTIETSNVNSNNLGGFLDELKMSLDIYGYRYISSELNDKDSIQ